MMMMMMMNKNKQNISPTSAGSKTSPPKSPKPGIEPAADGEVMIKVMAKKPVRSSPVQGQTTTTNKKTDNSNNNDRNSSPVKQTQENIPSTKSDNCLSTSPTNNNNTNCKHNNNNNQQQDLLLRQKDIQMDKLKKDLAKCQLELRDELEKRGQSTSARAAQDRDRARLLKEIRELDVSKRRLESALEEASSALKKKTQEVRLVKEASRREVATLEKEVNMEVKKLLEDLKVKDNLLATLDRNQYSDRTSQIKLIQQKQQQQQQQQQQQEGNNKTKSPSTSPSPEGVVPPAEGSSPLTPEPNKHPRKGEGTTTEEINNLKRKICDLERSLGSAGLEKFDLEKQNKDILATKQNLEATIARLRDDNMQLNADLNAVQYEVKRLNDSLTKSNVEEMIVQFERLKNTTNVQKSLINKLQKQIKNGKKSNSPNQTPDKSKKKTVKFMLPGYSDPIVNGRVAYKEDMRYLFEDIDIDDDDCYFNGDNEVQYYFESANDDDDEADDDDGGGGHNNDVKGTSDSNKKVIRKTPIQSSTANIDDDDDNDDEREGDDDDPMFSSDDDNDVSTCHDGSSLTSEPVAMDTEENALPPAEQNGDYKLLMKEHLQLEQSVAGLVQSIPPHNWMVEKESLQIAMMALESRNHEYQLMVDGLKSKMEELREKNEELEFQVLEFEGSGNEILKKEQEVADFALIERNSKLEQEIRSLQVRLLKISSSSSPSCGDDSDGSKIDEFHQSMSDAETQWSEGNEDDIPESECDQMSVMETNATSLTSTSGFDDLSSDEENSFESMPQDEKPPHKSSTSVDHPQKAKRSEDYWMKFSKSLEVKLACSRMRERQLQDKLALLCEEKNRIIRDLDRYATSDTDSLIELDSGIDMKSTDGDSEDLGAKVRSSPHLRLDFSVDVSSRMDDQYLIDTPTSADLYFPKHVQSLTVEDETDALHQRICHLEKDCELLKEIIDMDEGIIRDLQFKVDELEGSERNLNKVVDRLEGVERVLRMNESAANEENARLKVELTRSRSIEENLQSQLDMTRFDESQLKHKLDEVLEELRQTEVKLKRKTLDSERERKASISANEKLEDHVGELEAVVELLKRRNQNLQRLCEDTNNKLTETESACKRFRIQAECMEQQRDAFVARIQILEKDKQMAAEKFNGLTKNLSDKVSELEMADVEIKGLRACLDSSEVEVEKWMKKAEGRADVEVLLMKEMEEMRLEKEAMEGRFWSVCREMKSQKSILPQSSSETQTEPSFTIFVNKLNGDDEETVVAVTDDDEASMEDVSDDEHELDDDLPLDEIRPKCPTCYKDGIKWGSLDSLWYKLGAKNNSFGNSKAFRDKFTQTLLPLMPYLRKMNVVSSLMNEKQETKSSSKIPVNAKYFNQSNTSYISRPPIKMNPTVQSCGSTYKLDLQLDKNCNNTPLTTLDFDLTYDSVQDHNGPISSIQSRDGPSTNPPTPGHCASQ